MPTVSPAVAVGLRVPETQADPKHGAHSCGLGRLRGLRLQTKSWGWSEAPLRMPACLAVLSVLGLIAHSALFSKDEAASVCGVGSVSCQSRRRRSQAFGL